jgi:AcrR family transcriptional regulator
MAESVKGRRRYVSPRRQEQARQTRRSILDAARAVLIERGYGATMATIAARAGVSLETVYAVVGSKPVLVQTLIDLALAGGDEELPALERDYVRRIRAEPNAARKLGIYAAALGSIHERLAPLYLLVRAAAATHPEAAALWRTIGQRRAENMLQLAEDLAAAGGLRAGVSIEEARDVLWTMNSAEFYDLLVGQRGWSPDRFATWLAGAWQQLLLGQPPARAPLHLADR